MTNAVERRERVLDRVTVRLCGPWMVTEGNDDFNTVTCTLLEPHALKKLHSVAANKYTCPLCSRYAGIGEGGLKV
jgi:hypothetical protein